ncbi:MAG: PQQ-like beta-propeller repeat protein, partial [Planctomycetaceae bacterium]|nr:PQQ-like beta-propeller repeat protein [Planctomycetaceae bacterium]
LTAVALLLPVIPFLPGHVTRNVDAADSDNWPHWRGPTANGVASPEARPPVEWGPGKNIRWVAALPGEGSSTPIIHAGRIYVTSAAATDRQAEEPLRQRETSKTTPPGVYYRFDVTCLDRNTGDVVWQKTLVEAVPHEGHHPTHTYAASSPTTDGKRLYVSFASRGLFALNFDGDILWEQDLGDMHTRFGWGEAVTPVLAGDQLIVNWDQEEHSFICALNCADGKISWKTDRPGEVTSWNTPLIVSAGNRTLAVVNGTGRVRAYDVANGEEIWQCGGQTVNAIPSPLPFQNNVICVSGYRSAFAVSIPVSSTGDVTESASLNWKYGQGTPYVPSPVISGERLLFTAGNTDVLSCISAGTGQELLPRRRLTGLSTAYASPVVAGGNLYFTGRDGVTVVLRDDDSLTPVATNSLNDTIDASPVAVGSQLFLRSWSKLYCIEQQ